MDPALNVIYVGEEVPEEKRADVKPPRSGKMDGKGSYNDDG